MLLSLELVPGVKLGAFSLGMPLWNAVAYVRGRRADYSCVEVKYADKEPFGQDVVLNFPEHGLHLRFEPKTQRLRLIEVYDTSRLQIRYGKGVLGGAAHAATAMLVYELLGPAVPGTLDVQARLYRLRYEGALFLFPIPAQHVQHCQGLAGELPLEFPDDTTPVASRICIYAGSAEAPEDIAAAVPPPLGPSCCCQPVEAILGEGLNFAEAGQQIGFGDTPQDVCAELGQPSSASSKPPDPGSVRMRTGALANGTGPRDYFYSYEDRGLDILFDGSSDRAKKFVLHTNPPGHTDFGLYLKCNFRLNVKPRSEQPHTDDQREESSSDDANPLHIAAPDSSEGLIDAGREDEVQSSSKHADSLAETSRSIGLAAAVPDRSGESGISGPSTPSKGIMGFLEDLVKSPTGETRSWPSDKGKDQAWEWDSPAWTNSLLDFGSAATPGREADPAAEQLHDRAPSDGAAPDSLSALAGSSTVRQDREDAAEALKADQRDGWDDLDALDINLEEDPLNRTSPDAAVLLSGSVAAPSDNELASEPDDSRAAPIPISEIGRLEPAVMAEGRHVAPDPPDGQQAQVQGPQSSRGSETAAEAVLPPELTANSSLEDIKAAMGDAGTAKVHMRGQSSHPFGRTQVYGYRGACFEVMRNGYLASVTLY